MKFIKDLGEGSRLSDIYFCKSKTIASTKNGKTYYNIVLQDKTGTLDAKIWEPNSSAIGEFEAMDYIDVVGEVTLYNGSLQSAIKRLRKADEGEYNTADYVPSSRYSNDAMYEGILKFAGMVENKYLKALLDSFFVEDKEFIKLFRESSAAKSIHHGFVGGLLEHTLGVVRICQVYTKAYPFLNKDLLLTAAIMHDIGKVRELSLFPQNDYTDEGQFLGHIYIGTEMIHENCSKIEGFPPLLERQLKHCILAHHGELEYGSPKKPEIAEAVALSLADLTDARMESFREAIESAPVKDDWLGYSRIFDSNIRKTTDVTE